MKNKILLALTFLIGIFFSFTSVKALTKINFNEEANGKINTTLHFEEGFVGGIDITFKINGDVNVKSFDFSDKIKNSKYETKYEFKPTEKVLKVYVSTGGIGTSHNLLNEKKELALGTIVFDSDSKNDVTYKLSETKFDIIDNNWNSVTIEQSHITFGDKVQFVYKATNTDPVNPPEEDNPKPGESDPEESNPGETNPGESDNPSEEDKPSEGESEGNTPSEGTNPSEGETEEKPSEENPKDDEDTDKKDENEQKPSSNNNSQNQTSNENTVNTGVDKENSNNWLIICLAIVIVIAVIGCIYYFVIKKKNNN